MIEQSEHFSTSTNAMLKIIKMECKILYILFE